LSGSTKRIVGSERHEMGDPNTERGLRCGQVLLTDGWASDQTVRFNQDGAITGITGTTDADATFQKARGPVIPGMANLHSHAFQYGMAGLAEKTESAGGFWSWRDVMYRVANTVDPDGFAAIAAQLYADMLRQGFTAVGEFHYLHHAPDGRPYDSPATMSLAAIEAARRTGIALTHLPVLYAHGGFGGAPPGEDQRRFIHDSTSYSNLIDALSQSVADEPDIQIGIAAHSLRAVTPDQLSDAADLAKSAGMPIHIHVAEQPKEVDDCRTHLGARPVEWLLDNLAVDDRWCLIHATHMTPAETEALARSGAVAGLCPTTEANLGDGIFDTPRFLDARGAFGIGTDSHISADPAQELRLLEYGQRLTQGRRGILGCGHAHTGAGLYRTAAKGGGRALGRKMGVIAAGYRADFVVLDREHSLLTGRNGDTLLDSLVFAAGAGAVRDVFVGGRKVIDNGRHAEDRSLKPAFQEALKVIIG
jgi:formimidoylglutamate deiminase